MKLKVPSYTFSIILNKFSNYFRCSWIFNNNFIYFVIGVSLVTLILDNPLGDPEDEMVRTVQNIDRVVGIIFAVEAACRIIALGFFWSCIP